MEQLNNYPGLFTRVKAAVVDNVLVFVLIMLASEVLSDFDSVATWVRILVFVFIFVLYEPLFISAFGMTIGHNLLKIKVQKDKPGGGNINIFLAIVRFLIKYALGWVSLLTIMGNEKRKAIHDLAINTIVVVSEK